MGLCISLVACEYVLTLRLCTCIAGSIADGVGKTSLVVATDVAARGLDIKAIQYVFLNSKYADGQPCTRACTLFHPTAWGF